MTTRSYTDLQTEWNNIMDSLDQCQSRILALEARLGLLMPDDRPSLYTEEDVRIFQANWERLQQFLQDQPFMDRAATLISNITPDTYNLLHEYIRNQYPGFVIQIYDSCNGIIFLSETNYNEDIFTWNIGARSEIILSLMANSISITHPFFQDMINQGYGYAKRTRFLDARQTDLTEYHFVCRQLLVGGRIVFIALREKI